MHSLKFLLDADMPRSSAKLAGLTLSNFMYELGKHKIGFTNITEEELEEELRRIK